MTMVYHDDDGDLSHLSGKQVGVIGYGAMGRPIALNLRDSGAAVIVGGRTDESRAEAEADGFTAQTIAEAVKTSRIILLMLPNEIMPQFYLEQVSPHLKRGDMLAFASAYNVAFGFIEAPPFVDVGLIAPRLMGAAVRERYQSGEGFSSFIAVGQDASGQTWPTLLALAKAIGALKAGAVEIGFEQEAALDLFTQQAILPAFYHLMKTAAQLLIEKGFPVEAVLTELYFSGEFAHFLRQVEYEGLIAALCRTPLTNQYGTLSRMERFNDLKLERLLEVTLDEIRSAKFAHEWAKEYADGRRRLETLLKNPANRELLDLEEQTLDLLGRAGGFDA